MSNYWIPFVLQPPDPNQHAYIWVFVGPENPADWAEYGYWEIALVHADKYAPDGYYLSCPCGNTFDENMTSVDEPLFWQPIGPMPEKPKAKEV